jgi:hypothetical protein
MSHTFSRQELVSRLSRTDAHNSQAIGIAPMATLAPCDVIASSLGGDQTMAPVGTLNRPTNR